MTNSEETDRGINAPRVISIPGSHLDVETRRLRDEIQRNLAAGNAEHEGYYELADLVEKLAKLEDW